MRMKPALVSGVIENVGGDARAGCTFKAEGIGAVGNHRADAGRACPVLQAVNHGLQITAGAGQQHHHITALGHVRH
jgi:hypothetical protein